MRGLRLLAIPAAAALACAAWFLSLALTGRMLSRAEARMDAARTEAVPAAAGERAARGLWRARKAHNLVRLVPTQFALEHFEEAWLNAAPEEQQRYIRWFGAPLAGMAGAVFGTLLGFWRRLPARRRLALIVVLVYPILFIGTFVWSQRGSDSPLCAVAYGVVRPYDALLSAATLSPSDLPADAPRWHTDRAVINAGVYVAAVWALTLVAGAVRRRASGAGPRHRDGGCALGKRRS